MLATNKTNEAFQNYRGALKVAGEIGSVRKDVLVRIILIVQILAKNSAILSRQRLIWKKGCSLNQSISY
ncbi:MAG: hypothetical protein CM15mP117_06930 [Alphaproteobacteria bacterium]|nr:MAG: hypothetical protein CM15mP117_06930 [Alphaproteobacteria bacterium]